MTRLPPRRPYGYRCDQAAHQLVPIHGEQAMIAIIVNMFEREGLTPKEITKEMNLSYPPPMNSHRWHRAQVERILKRESDEYGPLSP